MATKEDYRRKSEQYQDQAIPERIMDLIRDNKITMGDLLILCAIDSLVRHNFAHLCTGTIITNKCLSEMTGLNKTYISDRIQYLHEKNLLAIIMIAGQRHLETTWLMTPEKINSFEEGEYSEMLREWIKLRTNQV